MPDDRNYYQETLDRMEQEIAAVDTAAALPSIAISLKRIADVMEATAKPMIVAKSELSEEERDRLAASFEPGPITPAPKDPMERIATKLDQIYTAIRQGLSYVAGSTDRGGF